MKLISDDAIKEALRSVKPERIAVAFVGADWARYIDREALRELVVSPALGSNPGAILQIAETIGWENLHLLDQLHAKVYIGPESAAIGSFNMTFNGLSGQALEEAGCLVRSDALLAELNTLFDEYKRQAAKCYSSPDDKRKRLALLQAQWRNAVRSGAIADAAVEPSLLHGREPMLEPPYVCSTWGELTYTAQVDEPGSVRQSLGFLENDKVEKNRWILCWHADDDGMPLDEPLYWMYVDEVVPKGATGTEYTKLAIERNDRQTIRPPFELTEQVGAAVRKLLRSGAYPQMLCPENRWSINPTLPLLDDFFAALQRELAEQTATPAGAGAARANKGEPDLDTLRQQFSERIHTAMDISLKRRLVTQSIAGMLAKRHAVDLAKEFARPGGASRAGLRALVKAGAPELSFESIMLEPQFRPLFTKGELECARFHLDHPEL